MSTPAVDGLTPDRVVRFDAGSFDADVIQRAAYRFSDQFTMDLVRREHEYVCTLFPRSATSEDAVREILHGFRAEVLDQVLRRRIREETAAVRNVVLAVAFSRTSLLGDEA